MTSYVTSREVIDMKLKHQIVYEVFERKIRCFRSCDIISVAK